MSHLVLEKSFAYFAESYFPKCDFNVLALAWGMSLQQFVCSGIFRRAFDRSLISGRRTFPKTISRVEARLLPQ